MGLYNRPYTELLEDERKTRSMKRPELIQHNFDGIIALLIEECGEVIQAIGKLNRFGKHAKDPRTGIEYDNVKNLEEELEDLETAISFYWKVRGDDVVRRQT